MSNQEDVNQNDIQWIKKALIRIEEQTKLTNGRVTALENWKLTVVAYTTIFAAIATLIVNKII